MHMTEITWRDGLVFDAKQNGRTITLSGLPEGDDERLGVSPKELLLTALGGCTAMDVAAILKKMRVPYSSLTITVDGKISETHPKVYHTILVKYKAGAAEIHRSRVEEAVQLSISKYCGVYAMLSQVATIHHEIELVD